MEKLVRNGKAKSIGLSNFNKTQIQRIFDIAEIKPTNLQVRNFFKYFQTVLKIVKMYIFVA